MPQKKKILIVDDEKQLVSLVSLHMKMSGYEVLSAKDGEEALAITKEEAPDLIILDLMLPKIDGWEVCKRLRAESKIGDIPVIMLTARSEAGDKLKGFECGADDYVTKPFSPRELVARVKRVLARAEKGPSTPTRYSFGDVDIDLENFTVKVKDEEIPITEKERGILKVLISRPGELFTRDQLLDAVWSNKDSVEYGNIDVHIRHLREKIEKDPENPQIIKTVKGAGYICEVRAV
ncbi:MAG: response regulator transcription factor [Candidatus Omnitrophota bacterium]